MKLWNYAVYIVLIFLLSKGIESDGGTGWYLVMIGLAMAFFNLMREQSK